MSETENLKQAAIELYGALQYVGAIKDFPALLQAEWHNRLSKLLEDYRWILEEK